MVCLFWRGVEWSLSIFGQVDFRTVCVSVLYNYIEDGMECFSMKLRHRFLTMHAHAALGNHLYG